MIVGGWIEGGSSVCKLQEIINPFTTFVSATEIKDLQEVRGNFGVEVAMGCSSSSKLEALVK